MSILIIPDVHGRSFWKEPIEKYKEQYDKIIFLGDFSDSYNFENITRKETIKILKDVIDFKINNMDKTILLIGNHKIISLKFLKIFGNHIFIYNNM